jgi:lipoprotein-anchoring transpeptidase ErfK/SrfK
LPATGRFSADRLEHCAMAQQMALGSSSALPVASSSSSSRAVLWGLLGGAAVLCVVYAIVAVTFVSALPSAALDLRMPTGDAMVAVDTPIVIDRIGWGTRVDDVRVTEYTLDSEGRPTGQRDVPVRYESIRDGQLPGEGSGMLVRADGSPLLRYDARYEVLVRGTGEQWTWTGQRMAPVAAAAVVSTPLSPAADWPADAVVSIDQPFAIGFNVPVESLEYTIQPAIPSRLSFNAERDIAYISISDFEQGAHYSVDITGAQATSGAPMNAPATATFTTPAALRLIDVTPRYGEKDVAPGLDPVLTFSAPIANPDLAADAIQIEPAVDGHFEWLAPNKVKFVTDKGFTYSTNVEITVQPGPESFKSVEGGFLDEPATLAFRTRARKSIDVNLSAQRVQLLEDGVVVYTTTASTGVRGAETPTGNFSIQYKMEKTRMRGVNPSGHRYDIPDVPWVMAIFDDYAFHGAPWRQAWGTPLSNGCISMPTANAKYVYDWTPVGTPIHIHY